ncbi:MAG: nucleoside triphosphate pyrophosphohydrolase [Chitinophagaceae bacterium]|nr:nucleoside triphosphate pyrophosphohydrolase [Chitinophagaceae bacterium]
MQVTADSFLRLVKIMDELREQCPWDKKQTIETLRPLTIEETYELADAITEKNWQHIKEELGDLMLHLLFYSKIGTEQQQFTLDEVINGVCEKLIARHPHIYPPAGSETVEVKNEEDVKRNWEKLKLKEGKTSVLSGVPKGLPSLVKAIRIQEKAKQVGFEWDNKDQVFQKIEEEMGELKEVVLANNRDQMEEELGDVFFSLVNYARFLQIDADHALERTNRKFIQRFTQMEQEAVGEGKQLVDMSLQEMDLIWNRIKIKNREV